MKTFFDGIFITDNEYQENLEYPIKLEYYKTIQTEENVEAKYGIEIVKTEYKDGKVNIENNIVNNLTPNVEEAERILTILKNNTVTPIGMQDVLKEMFTE